MKNKMLSTLRFILTPVFWFYFFCRRVHCFLRGRHMFFRRPTKIKYGRMYECASCSQVDCYMENMT